MGQYSKEMQGEFISDGNPWFVPLPFETESFCFMNKTQWDNTSANTAFRAEAFRKEKPSTAGDTYAEMSNGTASQNATLTTGGIEFISAGTPTFGAVVAATTPFVTVGATTTITSTGHPYKVGDTILLFGVTGMNEIAGIPYVVLTVNTNDFTISADTSAITDTATAASMMLVKYPDLYIPFGCVITAMTLGNPTVVTTTVNHSFVPGQQIRFQIPKVSTGLTPWGPTALDGVKAFVLSVTATTVTIDYDSTGLTAFEYPLDANSVGTTPAMILPIGDKNFGVQTLTPPPLPFVAGTSIAGAFMTNTRQGVLIGTGDGTVTLHADGDVIHWFAEFPDGLLIQ